jgi:hypothetical protein
MEQGMGEPVDYENLNSEDIPSQILSQGDSVNSFNLLDLINQGKSKPKKSLSQKKKLIFSCLEKGLEVETLIIREKGIGDLDLISLTKALRKNKKLSSLDICQNPLTLFSMPTLRQLARSKPSLIKLKFNILLPKATIDRERLRKSKKITKNLVKTNRVFLKGHSVKTLDLSNNLVSRSTLNSLIPRLKYQCCLKKLILSHAGLTDQEIKKIGKVITENPSITYIDIRNNPRITQAGRGLLKTIKKEIRPELEIIFSKFEDFSDSEADDEMEEDEEGGLIIDEDWEEAEEAAEKPRKMSFSNILNF